jgi:uncharacterized protein
MSPEIRRKIQMGETAAAITCEKEYASAVIDGIAKARAGIIAYAKDRPEFILSLEPLQADADAPETVKRMCVAAKEAGVGPMAAVAGAIAEAGVEVARSAGASHCIVDNGGDIALLLDHPVIVGILDKLDSDLLPAVEIAATDGEILGLCTSSGVFGHSISFGRAEAATVMARSAPLADALATALGNECKDGSLIRKALESISGIDGVLWAMAIVDGHVGTMGEMPKMLQAKKNIDAVTVHSDFPGSILADNDSES